MADAAVGQRAHRPAGTCQPGGLEVALRPSRRLGWAAASTSLTGCQATPDRSRASAAWARASASASEGLGRDGCAPVGGAGVAGVGGEEPVMTIEVTGTVLAFAVHGLVQVFHDRRAS